MFQIREQKGGGRRERERESRSSRIDTATALHGKTIDLQLVIYTASRRKKSLFAISSFLYVRFRPLSLSLLLSLVLLIICSIRHPTIVIHLPPQKCYCANCRQCDFIRLFTFYIEEEEKKIQNIYLNLKEKDYKDKIPTNRGLLILLFLFLLLFLPFVYAHCDIFIYHFETPLDPKKGNNI